MEIKGKIILIGTTQELSNDFKKRDIVIETTEEQYPQKLKVEFIKDKCSVLDGFKLNEEVTIGINLRGNEYQGKYYVQLQGWKINKVGTQSSAAPTQSSQSSQVQNNQTDEDGLPF